MYKRFFKRLADIAASFTGLAVLSPVLLVLFVLVRVKLGSPAVFKQDRPGLKGKIFRMYKFRTMTDERDENGALLPDERRLTRFGKLLRSLSLDELPELWNILKGDMSVVGPRPLLVQYLPLYSEEQARRHDARPGLTGYAQVNGRNAISWQEKFKLDCWYVDHLSFWLDIKIALATFVKVFQRSGVNSASSATMEAFTGNGGEESEHIIDYTVKHNIDYNTEYIIIGAGGHAAVIADILLAGGFTVKGFLDDVIASGTEITGVKVLGKTEDCLNYPECLFIIGIGDNRVRKKIAEKYSLSYGTAMHPSAVIGRGVEIGAGSVLMAGSVINPRARLGAHCILNTRASLDHDGRLGDYVHISPGAALGGTVAVGELTHIGLGACVKNNINICGGVTVGAGAAVVKNITEPGVYVGVPAGKLTGK